ncbi:MAG: AbrB/MazE/SpoVT family DNA-binding domain-containing protein [Thaumarchaeota archaeon]|nr:AbrB/MazE/SpoVT family DNA-binding domain-containing protein [Nitrososphaerota archaeon]
MPDVLVDATKLSERGQVVIPKDIRDKLGLQVGAKIVIFATEDTIILQKAEFVAQSMKTKDIVSKALEIIRKLGLMR